MLDSVTAKESYPEGSNLLECMRLDFTNPNRMDFNSQNLTSKFPQFFFSLVLLFILTSLWDANRPIHV
jgi:hypothetical protein